MNNITINMNNQSIVINKNFSKKANVYGTEAYNALQQARKDYPSYKVVVKEQHTSSVSFKGLTFEFMKNYIQSHDNAEAMEAEFNSLKDNVSYGAMKKWFFEKYPQFKDCKSKYEMLMVA